MSEDALLNVAATMSYSRSNGPGLRAVIWVQGCTIGCPGCYNSFTHLHEQRTLATPETIAEWVSTLEGIEGVSFSGGEPFEQAEAVLLTINEIRKLRPELSFFSYTGFELKYLRKSENKSVQELLLALDMLCSGPFVESLKNTNLLWRGSENQKLIYMSDKYSKTSELEWELASPVEEYQYGLNEIHSSGFGGDSSPIKRLLMAKE